MVAGAEVERGAFSCASEALAQGEPVARSVECLQTSKSGSLSIRSARGETGLRRGAHRGAPRCRYLRLWRCPLAPRASATGNTLRGTQSTFPLVVRPLGHVGRGHPPLDRTCEQRYAYTHILGRHPYVVGSCTSGSSKPHITRCDGSLASTLGGPLRVQGTRGHVTPRARVCALVL